MADAMRTIRWSGGRLMMIDQTELPSRLTFVEYESYEGVADAIRRLVVRGAPAIGVAGAFGLVLAARQSAAASRDGLLEDMRAAHDTLLGTRPTAVNLKWSLDGVMEVAGRGRDPGEIRELALAEAERMAEEDIRTNRTMGRHGAALFGDDTIMTHCNAGALATVSYGTALGVIRAAREAGRRVRVIATETRPVQQGSRLTAFELKHDGVDVSLIPDTAVGYSMANGMVDKVIVGADRILRTGHVYNKIGTYQVAAMAKRHSIPFYVAAPLSTFDMQSGPEDVVIEQRRPEEVTTTGGRATAPGGIGVINPAFDMTPPELVSAIITERGIALPPYEESIARLFGAGDPA